jgi:transcriptional regulator of aromatic amino acid metabolism
MSQREIRWDILSQVVQVIDQPNSVLHPTGWISSTMAIRWKRPMSNIVLTGPELKTYLGMPAIVCSAAMRQLLELVERIAQTNAAVLITGESGSGKELIARAVHH